MGWAKLNLDGSTFGSTGHVGGGGVIRDHDGQWLKRLCNSSWVLQ